MKILIVENEFLLAEALAEEVAHAGHTVLGPVPTGSEALKLLEDTQPDLALLNIRLSRGELGTDLAVDLNVQRGIPCVFVSASEELAEEFHNIALGIIDKPWTGRTIQEALQVIVHLITGEPVSKQPAGLTLFTQAVNRSPVRQDDSWQASSR